MRFRAARFLAAMAERREARAALLLGALFLAFLAISWLVHVPGMQHVDVRISRGIQTYRTPPLDRTASFFTFLGSVGILAALSFAAAIVLYVTGRRRAALLALGSMLWLPLNLVVKDWIGRPRPAEGDMVSVLLPTIGLSFPSGHAMGSTAVYGFLALMAWVHFPRGWRIPGTVTPALIALGISLSRIYVGAHWFSDVVGGWTAGLFLVFLIDEIYRAIGKQDFARLDVEGRHAANQQQSAT